MFFEVIKQRIDLYNELSNRYQLENTLQCKQNLENDMKTLIIVIGLLLLFYIIIFILSFYYIFKCSMVKKWPIAYPLILVLLSLIPTYGGIFTVGILIYGMINCGSLCDSPSDIFSTKLKIFSKK